MFNWSWTIDLVASFCAICIVIAVTMFDLQQDGVLWTAILLRIIAKISSMFVDMLLLLVLLMISETNLKHQFDKVCKKKFLNFLDPESQERLISE